MEALVISILGLPGFVIGVLSTDVGPCMESQVDERRGHYTPSCVAPTFFKVDLLQQKKSLHPKLYSSHFFNLHLLQQKTSLCPKLYSSYCFSI